MSNKLFQGVIHQMRGTIDRTIGVIDNNSSIIACNNLESIGEIDKHINKEHLKKFQTFTADNYTYSTFGNKEIPEYVLFVKGTDKQAEDYAKILSISFNNIKKYFDEKHDICSFVKNIILDNILSGDIYIKSRELNFNENVNRVCILVRSLNKFDETVYDLLQNLFPNKKNDYIININETDTVIVKEVKENILPKHLESLASSIIDTLSSEFCVKCTIGIGTINKGIKELSDSFKNAQVALEVSKVFDTEKNIISYENLGIARLIYQLPTTLCEMFLKEIFKKGTINSLDQETLFTIEKFFENSLNVSETSRKLFVHRNTLVYRLEKIKKITGLDLRCFEDAIVFKVALMVKKYLTSKPVKY